MAAAAPEVLSNVEMWLPSEFLGDDFFMEEKRYRSMEEEGGGPLFPYDCDSNLSSSPLESEDSDAEECHVEPHHHHHHNPLLTIKTPSPLLTGTHITNTHTATNNTKGGVSSSLACSPQSPLVTWSDHHPKGPTQPCSPPDNAAAWYQLCAAAGRMSLAEELVVEQQQKLGGACGLLGAPRKLSSAPCAVPQKNPTQVGYSFDGAVHHRPQHNGFQLNQFQQLKQKQLLKQQLSAAWSRQNSRGGIRGVMGLNGNSNTNHPRGGCHPSGPSRSTWPPLQPQPPPGSGMRAVFLGGAAGARKQSSGTGVFLPRRVGSPTEPRKKPACSTVLLPAKVVQALNLNLEEMGGVVVSSGGHPNPRLASGLFLDQEIIMNGRSGATLPLKRVGPVRPTPPQLPSLGTSHPPHQEVHLPPEWTY